MGAPMRITLMLTTLFGFLVLGAGCGVTEAEAKHKLEEDKLTNIELTKTDAGFTFSAKDAEGSSCTGTINGEKGPGT